MLLFLSAVILLFLSGGFLPSVFLPEPVRRLAAFLPTTALMNGAKMMVTGAYRSAAWLHMAVLWRGGIYALAVGGEAQMMKVLTWFFLSCKRYLRRAGFSIADPVSAGAMFFGRQRHRRTA